MTPWLCLIDTWTSAQAAGSAASGGKLPVLPLAAGMARATGLHAGGHGPSPVISAILKKPPLRAIS